MTAFDNSAEYYEALANSEQRLKREGPFLLERLEQAPGRRVVDIACGTGPHAFFFAEHGAQVDAFDFSEKMAAYAARHRPHPNITYRTGDMRHVEGGPWDLAVCLGNSLSVLTSDQDLADTFASVYRCLSPRGLFLVQVLNYAAQPAQEARHRVEHRSLDSSELSIVKSLVPRGDHTLLTLNFFAFHTDRVETISEAALLRNWRLGDLTESARRTGFQVHLSWGGFDARPYLPDTSPDLILSFSK